MDDLAVETQPLARPGASRFTCYSTRNPETAIHVVWSRQRCTVSVRHHVEQVGSRFVPGPTIDAFRARASVEERRRDLR
jgi:hypothetical protein